MEIRGALSHRLPHQVTPIGHVLHPKMHQIRDKQLGLAGSGVVGEFPSFHDASTVPESAHA